MKSITLFTEEIDDIETGVNDLLQQLDDFELLTNSLGLLFVPTDLELACLTEQLQEKLDFPVVGATGMAFLNDKCGFQDSGIFLQIMTADDCCFSSGITNGITERNLEAEIGSLCSRLQGQAREPVKLALAYVSVPRRLSAESYLQAVEKALPGLPVYGAVAADDFSFEDSCVFRGGDIRGSGAVLVLVSGNVRPVMHCEYSISRETLLPGKAVCGNGGVARIGERSLIEALQTTGLRSEKDEVIEDFVSLPFVADMPVAEDEYIRVVRHLMRLDHETGSGRFIGEIKEGTQFSISIMDKDYIYVSVQRAFRRLLDRLEQERDYQYSTLICTSCAARHMVLTGAVADEGDALLELLPGSLSLNGMYSLGELCPIRSSRGRELNAFHNTAFTILAM